MRIKWLIATFTSLSFQCFGSVDSLEIEKFTASIGAVKRIVQVNLKTEVHFPVPPMLITIILKEDLDHLEKKYICILTDTVNIYDTLNLGKSPRINLYNLPGGSYSAKFINLENNASVIQRFKIGVPFWQKWWFPPLILIVITAFLGMIFYFIHKIQLRQKLRTQFIRDNIARDLHDDIGSYLSSISILSQNVDIMLASNPERAKTSLAKIGNTAREVMDTMGDIVWSINPNQDTMPLIIQRMKDLMSELFSEQNVLTTFRVDESIQKQNVSLEKKRDFYLIFKEAVTNVQKYANASKIDVNIKYEENNVVLTIEDNGIGFDVEPPERKRSNGGNGLINMEMRARRLGGMLNILTERGKGTTISLIFPK